MVYLVWCYCGWCVVETRLYVDGIKKAELKWPEL